MIDDTLIDEFPGHPYKLYTGKRYTDLLESVQDLGVITPVILRREENGRYTLLAGYNRRRCNQVVGNKQIPAVIRQGISDGEAKLIITHSNRQRGLDELLPSEKAFAFKMEMEGLKETRKQLQKVDLITQLESAINTDEQAASGDLFKLEQMKYSREILADHYGLNSTELHRLIRLTYLCPELLGLVDDTKLPVYVAVPITYLPADAQILLYQRITQKGCKVDIKKAELLKAKHKPGELTEEVMDGILSGQLLPSKTPKRTAVKIKPVVLRKYFKEELNIAVLADCFAGELYNRVSSRPAAARKIAWELKKLLGQKKTEKAALYLLLQYRMAGLDIPDLLLWAMANQEVSHQFLGHFLNQYRELVKGGAGQ